MDKMEFVEAESNLNDLICEYQMGDSWLFDTQEYEEEDDI
jgi:hypothetical protein